MTRDEFITGVEFKIDNAYFRTDSDINCIMRVYRSNDKSKIVLEDYHMNVDVVGKTQFSAYTYMLGKKVVRKIKFSDLILV